MSKKLKKYKTENSPKTDPFKKQNLSLSLTPNETIQFKRVTRNTRSLGVEASSSTTKLINDNGFLDLKKTKQSIEYLNDSTSEKIFINSSQSSLSENVNQLIDDNTENKDVKQPKKRGRKPKALSQTSPNTIEQYLIPKSNEVLIRPRRSLKISKPIDDICKSTPKKEDKKVKSKRGRKPKSETSDKNKPTSTRTANKKAVILDDYEESEEEQEESDSDAEFKIDDNEAEDSDDDLDEKNDEDDDDDDDDIEIIKKGKKFTVSVSLSSNKTYKTRTAIKSNKVLASDDEEDDEMMNDLDTSNRLDDEDDAEVLNEFDLNLKISEWKYELDNETKTYTKPILPRLSEDAIKPFINDKSKPPKLIIYECPFCKRVFTYTLVFKNHLYSCDNNKNTPEYVLYCAKHPECGYKSKKKQELISHFVKEHTKQGENDEEDILDDDESDDNGYSINCKKKSKSSLNNYNQSSVKLSVTKQNQLEVSRYYYVSKKEFKFTYDYLNEYLAKSYKCLQLIDDFYLNGLSSSSQLNKSQYYHFVLKLESNLKDQVEIDNEDVVQKISFKESKNLLFKLDKNENHIEIKPFEMYNNNNKSKNSNLNNKFKLINVANQVTSLDWCPVKYNESNIQEQYLAFATLPLEELNRINLDTKNRYFNYKSNDTSNYRLKTLFESPNLIHICKFTNLNNELNKNGSRDDDTFEIFSILNKNIGNISCLKWRPDYGAAQNSTKNDKFIGYLLATSSNGNGYIYYIDDMTKHTESFNKSSDEHHQNASKTTINNLNVYESKKNVILKLSFSFGQCTAADWSQLNGAVQIAIGYANGSIAIFHVNKSYLDTQLSTSNDADNFFIYPVQTFDAHLTFVKTLKWSKLNSFILASGSLFSREIKIWDMHNLDKSMLDYESFVTEFAFSLHSNDFFIARETNLKGENRISALDLTFNVFNFEKDESRAHSSLFYIYSTMSSLDQSDYLNKLIICDNDGGVILSRSNDTKFWSQKHKLMSFSYAQIARFEINEHEDNFKNLSNKSYDVKLIETYKNKRSIQINLERIINNKQWTKTSTNQTNPISIDLNSLSKIKWNQNVNYNDWYATGSLSGFIFLHKINELNLNIKQMI